MTLMEKRARAVATSEGDALLAITQSAMPITIKL
jgi:hypothetical protein